MTTESKPPVVLIHGLYLTHLSWDKWVDRYREKGHEVLALGWPGMEGSPESLRQDPSPIAKLNVQQIVGHYERVIRGLAEPPIIMGHSLGGTITQLLLDRGLGTSAVGVEPGTVKGVLPLPVSTFKSNLAALRNPFARHKAVPISAKEFRYAFCNTMSQEDSDANYEKYYVPVARNVLLQVAFCNLSPTTYVKVDRKNPNRAPFLLMSGGEDHVIPPVVIRANHRLYRDSPAVTEIVEHPGRPHFTMIAPGWEAVADEALDWAMSHRKS